MIKFSIVCATHNKLDKLILTINNILKSNLLPNEIVICTTSSNDSLELKKNFDKKIKLICIVSKIKSQTYQRSLAVKASTNEIILQIDDDVTIFPETVENMIKHFAKNNKNIIVGGYLIYPNGKHVSHRFTEQYKKSFLLKKIYFFLNFFSTPSQMSILKSGRIFPYLHDVKEKKEWLSSFLMYKKSAYYLKKVQFNYGKGYYEDIIFTHNLYKNSYDLIMERNALAQIEFNPETGIKTYIKSLPMQFKFIKIFKKNLFLFVLDVLIFTIIHFLISLRNKK